MLLLPLLLLLQQLCFSLGAILFMRNGHSWCCLRLRVAVVTLSLIHLFITFHSSSLINAYFFTSITTFTGNFSVSQKWNMFSTLLRVFLTNIQTFLCFVIFIFEDHFKVNSCIRSVSKKVFETLELLSFDHSVNLASNCNCRFFLI